MPALMLSVGDDVAVEYRVPGDGAADGIVPSVTRRSSPVVTMACDRVVILPQTLG